MILPLSMTTPDPTQARLDTIRGRERNATEGSAWPSLCRFVITPNASEWDIDFIVHSRSDISYLLALCEERGKRVEELEKALRNMHDIDCCVCTGGCTEHHCPMNIVGLSSLPQ